MGLWEPIRSLVRERVGCASGPEVSRPRRPRRGARSPAPHAGLDDGSTSASLLGRAAADAVSVLGVCRLKSGIRTSSDTPQVAVGGIRNSPIAMRVSAASAVSAGVDVQRGGVSRASGGQRLRLDPRSPPATSRPGGGYMTTSNPGRAATAWRSPSTASTPWVDRVRGTRRRLVRASKSRACGAEARR